MEEPKDPYNILNYDQVFILLKEGQRTLSGISEAGS